MSDTPRHTQNASKRSTLVLMLIILVSLFAVGCGGEDFAITAQNNSNPANVRTAGNVVFKFVKPVPTNTTTMVFKFYDSPKPADGTPIFTATAAPANTVTVLDVPVNARSAIITFYKADQGLYAPVVLPIAIALSYLPFLAEGVNYLIEINNADIVLVTFDSISVSPNPVALVLGTQNARQQLGITGSFSNGQTIAFDVTHAHFSGNNGAVAIVDAGGIVTGVSNGSTSIDVDFTVDGVTRSQLDVPINVTGP